MLNLYYCKIFKFLLHLLFSNKVFKVKKWTTLHYEFMFNNNESFWHSPGKGWQCLFLYLLTPNRLNVINVNKSTKLRILNHRKQQTIVRTALKIHHWTGLLPFYTKKVITIILKRCQVFYPNVANHAHEVSILTNLPLPINFTTIWHKSYGYINHKANLWKPLRKYFYPFGIKATTIKRTQIEKKIIELCSVWHWELFNSRRLTICFTPSCQSNEFFCLHLPPSHI